MMTKTLTILFGVFLSIQGSSAPLFSGNCFESTPTKGKSHLDAQFEVVTISQAKLMGTLTFSPRTLLEEQVNFLFPAVEKSLGLPLHDFGLNSTQSDGSEIEIQVTYSPQKMKLFLIHSDKTSLIPQVFRFLECHLSQAEDDQSHRSGPRL